MANKKEMEAEIHDWIASYGREHERVEYLENELVAANKTIDRQHDRWVGRQAQVDKLQATIIKLNHRNNLLRNHILNSIEKGN